MKSRNWKFDQKYRFFNDFSMVWGSILAGFWEHVGLQKPFEIRSGFWDVFPRLDPTSGGARGDFGGTLPGVFPPQVPPGRPFRGRRDPITTSGSETRDTKTTKFGRFVDGRTFLFVWLKIILDRTLKIF